MGMLCACQKKAEKTFRKNKIEVKIEAENEKTPKNCNLFFEEVKKYHFHRFFTFFQMKYRQPQVEKTVKHRY